MNPEDDRYREDEEPAGPPAPQLPPYGSAPPPSMFADSGPASAPPPPLTARTDPWSWLPPPMSAAEPPTRDAERSTPHSAPPTWLNRADLDDCCPSCRAQYPSLVRRLLRRGGQHRDGCRFQALPLRLVAGLDEVQASLLLPQHSVVRPAPPD